MPRGLLYLIVVILLLAGGIVFLSMSAEDVPQEMIETEVVTDAVND